MSTSPEYRRAVEGFRAEYFFRSVVEARGNICAVARATGVHRNTITRVLRVAGYDKTRLDRLVRMHTMKKPPASASVAEEAQRRTA